MRFPSVTLALLLSTIAGFVTADATLPQPDGQTYIGNRGWPADDPHHEAEAPWRAAAVGRRDVQPAWAFPPLRGSLSDR